MWSCLLILQEASLADLGHMDIWIYVKQWDDLVYCENVNFLFLIKKNDLLYFEMTKLWSYVSFICTFFLFNMTCELLCWRRFNNTGIGWVHISIITVAIKISLNSLNWNLKMVKRNCRLHVSIWFVRAAESTRKYWEFVR